MANEQQLKYPVQRKAMQSVRDAVRRGHMDKPHTCSRCYRVDHKRNLASHHADYDQRLNVEWLCHQCHKDEHVSLKRGVR